MNTTTKTRKLSVSALADRIVAGQVAPAEAVTLNARRSRQADGEHGKLFACGLPTWVVSGALVGESFFRRNVSRKSWRPGPTTRISKPLEI